jgi:hypothetical protein
MEEPDDRETRYLPSPAVNSGVKLITLPWSSLAEEMYTVANMVAMADHTVASAVCRPDCRLFHYMLW